MSDTIDESEILAKFHTLKGHKARREFFLANPCLAKVFCESNFKSPAPEIAPAPIETKSNPTT